MPRPPLLLGVDVGGTTMAAGVVTPQGEVVLEERVPTYRDGPGSALRTLVELIAKTRAVAEKQGHTISGIGIGVPGPVDVDAGRIGDPVIHVPELAGRPLAGELTERYGVPVFVDNDVNALALGEWMFGAGRGKRSLVVLAAGTGIGAGIVLDGRIVRGATGFAGELGHVPVKFDGPRCFCGGRGCLSVYASGRGIADAARARVAGNPHAVLVKAAAGDPEGITAPLVFRAAADGDAVAASIVDEACQAMGAMIGIIVNGLNPEVVVVTGGVAQSLAPLEPKILGAAAEYALPRALAATRITIVPGDKRVGVRGAAALALYEERTPS
jgi:glucokinase